MRSRAFVVLGAAFALAAVSVYLARAWIAEQAGQERPVAAAPSAPVPTTQIVVAAGPIPYGSKVLRQKLRLADWPVDSVPQGSFTSLDEVVGSKGTGTGGRVVLRSLTRDEPVLKSKISGFGARASLSTLIAPGQRAATIRVNDINGVAGFVLPGDRVDVLLTRDIGSGVGGGPARRNLVTDVLLQNMKVLGIDQDANAEREQPVVVRAVTLEVTQPEAQKLTLAQKLGTLSLALRHANAADAINPRTITARDLPLAAPSLAIVAIEPPAFRELAADIEPTPARPPGWSVRIVRGLDVSVYDVVVEEPASGTEASRATEIPVPPSVAMPSPAGPSLPRRARPPVPGAQLEAASRRRIGARPRAIPLAVPASPPQSNLPQSNPSRVSRGPGENG